MAKYTGSNAKPKLQLTGTDGITYTYSLYKDYSTFPLTSGDGTYQVGVYENVSDDRYTTLLSETFSVTLTDLLKPYLYPPIPSLWPRPKNLQTVLPAIWTSSAVYIIISLHILPMIIPKLPV